MLNQSAISETFNIGAPLAFVTQKEAEVHNLATISVGVDSAMKPEDIRNLLFLLIFYFCVFFKLSFV